VTRAEVLSRKPGHVGAVAFSRTGDPATGDFGAAILDPAYLRWDDDDLTFEAVRWELLECSLVSCPADAGACIRLYGSGCDRAFVSADLSEDVRVRSLVKMRMMARQNMFEAQQAAFGS
jgi:hypothetical protein